jgi:predicted ATP-grasp superfamily ATP-dependent carboligase
MIPAVVIGTHTMGLGVIRALGRMGVPVVALYYRGDDMGFVSRYVQESIHVPHPEADEDRFIECLVNLASRTLGSPLFPVSDESLKIVSRNKPYLENYYKVACADWEIVQKLLKKNFTYDLAKSIGVPIPRTSTPASMDEVIAFGKGLEFPCLVKPVESHRYYNLFRRKIVKAENFAQLTAAYQEAELAGMKVMLQELIPGEDSLGVNYNSYFWNGEPVVEFTAKKIRSAPPELGSPCAAVSREVPAVLELGRTFLRAVNFYGYSCTEFKLDPRDGIYKLMEVNGRHNLSTLLAVNCGINFPWLHYRHLVEGIIPEGIHFREGLYWVDVERDLPYIPKRIFRQKESPLQILEPYIHPHVSAVYDVRDLKPFIKRYVDFSKQASHQLFTKTKLGQRNRRLP